MGYSETDIDRQEEECDEGGEREGHRAHHTMDLQVPLEVRHGSKLALRIVLLDAIIIVTRYYIGSYVEPLM